MIDIIVIRCDGEFQGEDVVDSMIVNTDVALQRGRYEINENSGMRSTTLRTTYRNDVNMGEIAEVHDALQGKVWRGKISAITHRSIGSDLYTDLSIQRPRNETGSCT